MNPAALTQAGPVEIGELLVGLPVAVAVVVLALLAWRKLSRGEILLSSHHEQIIAQLEARIVSAERERDVEAAEARYWQSIALRALNVSEAALGRRDAGT